MSQENVEIVRRVYDALNHGDWDAEGQTPIVAAFWLRAGKVFREETFTDRAEALEAVGLSEQDAHTDSS